jgi:hypothetical protein
MPYGFFQYDTPDFLTTPYHFLWKHHLVIHPKKAFFTPLFFTIPFLLHIPALIFIPLAQHFMGLLGVVFAGGLVQLWFKRWRWFIIPVTVLVAANPFAIWYEKTLMGEANFLFFTLLLALLGTLWVKNPSRANFVLLVLGLFFTAGTRGEAKLFYVLGMILVPLVLWGQWRRMLVHFGVVVLTMALSCRLGETSHAPSLLYATLVNLTPDKLPLEPGAAPYVLPLRDRYRAEWTEGQSDLVQVAKNINKALEPYIAQQYPKKHGKRNREMAADVFKKLSLDVLLTRPFAVFGVPFGKFQQASDGWSSGVFDQRALFKHQKNAVRRGEKLLRILSQGLTGSQKTKEEMNAFIDSHFSAERIRWFTDYQQAWNTAMISLRTPDSTPTKKRWVHDYIRGIPAGQDGSPGVPYFYMFALAGMVAAIGRNHLRIAHLGWVCAMLFVWWSATLVGVTNARFRFVYEPFCILYLFLLLDCLCGWIGQLLQPKKESAEAKLPESSQQPQCP